MSYTDNNREHNKGSRITITARITMWYSLFLVLIAASLLGVLLHLYNEQKELSAEARLIRTIDEAGNTIAQEGEVFLTDGRVDYYYNNVYISIYDQKGELLAGGRPDNIENYPDINTDDTQVVEDSSGGVWYVYDTTVNIEGQRDYIRGMLSRDEEEAVAGPLELNTLIVLLPIILLLAVLGGYLITRQAFAPVRRIIDTTEKIRRDGDLSRRIPPGNSRDEIRALADSFNGMFRNIEDMVKREKQFTADASHELRTPISVIQSQSEFAMEEPEYAPEAVAVINRESRKMSSLITNLLMISRSDAGRLTPDIKYVNAGELVREVVDVKQEMAEREGAVIDVHIEDGLFINTDEDMLSRIAINLIDNALKYGRHPDGTVKVSMYRDEEELVLRVSDNGEGVDEEYRDLIWERFYRTDEARTSGDSNGLGLSIVQTMVKSLKGSARLLERDESELGGASFEIRLPMTDAEEA